MTRKLAINGGSPTRENFFPGHYIIGEEEKKAISNFIDTKEDLSGFLGGWNDKFLGGKNVRAFEDIWSEFVKSKYTVSFNSNTSGLVAAIGAAGIEPGDEVIVTPYTMSATATAILAYQGIPVFADIDPETFCIDVNDVKSLINKKTKAIIAVNLFGHPAELKKLKKNS